MARKIMQEIRPNELNRQKVALLDSTSVTSTQYTDHFAVGNATGCVVWIKATSSAGTPDITLTIESSHNETSANYLNVKPPSSAPFPITIADENVHIFTVNFADIHEFAKFKITLGGSDGGDDIVSMYLDFIYDPFTGFVNSFPMAKYDSSQSTRTDGSVGVLQTDSLGNLQSNLATYIKGENSTYNIIDSKPLNSGTYCTSDTQISATECFVSTIVISPTDSAPTAGSIVFYKNSAASGTVATTFGLGTTWFAPITIHLNCICSSGFYVDFTTTADVNVHVSYDVPV